MSRILRALFISAVATGVAAAVLSVLSRREPGLPEPRPREPGAEALSEEQQRLLMQELASQL